ncbi:MAG: hypothetical protein JWP04_2525 [Belnapia sp.]|nr:hypothetical protein [Belnapia sp.]
MELNVLLRGQSNAQLMGEYNGGAQEMTAKVEALLGFDGIVDKVRLQYSSAGDTGKTVFSGTSFLTEWLKPDSASPAGWDVSKQEQSLLNFVDALPDARKADPTAVVWLHSEYDSRDGSLMPEEFASALRFDATLLREAYGKTAADLPYLFVSAIPYGQGTDQGHQAIRSAMESLVADPAFNARIAARALDTDMNFQDVTGDGRVDFGGPHQSDADGQQTAERIAVSLAQNWAQYAKPGSPMALAGGAVDDLGPQVVQATPVGPSQLTLTVGFDAAHSLAALDPAAADGLGWTVIGPDGTTVAATAAVLTGTDTLLLTFDGALPEGARLHYGHGYGRLAAEDGSGIGHAIYDDTGMPVWTAADGLLIGAAAPLLAPAGGAVTTTPGDAAAVPGLLIGTHDYAGSIYQSFEGVPAWGELGPVNLAPANWNSGWSSSIAVENIADVALDLRAAGTERLDVLLVGARGGAVALGDGGDNFTWVAQSDAAGVGNTLVLRPAGGDDNLHITAAGLSTLDDAGQADNGARYDVAYDGRYSTAELQLGTGNVTITNDSAVKLVVFGGSGWARVAGGSQDDIFSIGSGGGSFTGGGGADHWFIQPGAGEASIGDFTPGQDLLTFVGRTAADLTVAAAVHGGLAGLAITDAETGGSVFLVGVTGLAAGDFVIA